MTLDEAREILKDAIAKDGGLDDPVWYLGWNPIYMRQHLRIDGDNP